jgi:CBS domain-containing protein
MRSDIVVLTSTTLVRDAIAEIEGHRDDKSQHLYPVLDEQANLVGAISYSTLQKLAAGPDIDEVTCGSVADCQPPLVFSNEPLRVAVARMAESGATRLIVVNPSDARKLVGKVALHDVLRARSRHLEEERRRERVLPWEFVLPRWLRPGGAAK